MPPAAPLFLPGLPCHVLLRAPAGRLLFPEDRDRFVFLSLLRASSSACLSFEGFCLLPDRVHLLAIPSAPAARAALRSACAAYARYFRSRHNPRPRLFAPPAIISLLDDSARWRALAAVETEPVRARLASCPSLYLWSSAPAHLTAARPYLPLLLTHWAEAWPAASWRRHLQTVSSDLVFLYSFRRAALSGRPLLSPPSLAPLTPSLPAPDLPLFAPLPQSARAAHPAL